MRLEIYCDGGARGNPGPAAIGIYAEFSIHNFQFSNLSEINRSGQLNISKYIGIKTNNQAEYEAVVVALKWIIDNIEKLGKSTEKINIYIDSGLIVNQLNGNFKVKNAKLRELLLKIRGLETQINIPIQYSHIPREENQEADFLVNSALDKYVKN